MNEPRLALRVYRLLLRLYPVQFRQDYEREVLSTFRRKWEWQRSLDDQTCQEPNVAFGTRSRRFDR